MDGVEPPVDANEWTDEQWLAWLKATDADPAEEHPSSVMDRIIDSTPGQLLGQAMLGMARAIYGRQDEDVIIVAEGNGETSDDEPFRVRLDHDHPEQSSIVFKPGQQRSN